MYSPGRMLYELKNAKFYLNVFIWRVNVDLGSALAYQKRRLVRLSGYLCDAVTVTCAVYNDFYFTFIALECVKSIRTRRVEHNRYVY